MTSPVATIAALRALNDLIETGRMLEPFACRVDPSTADNLTGTLTRLDGVRTRLVEDGNEYLDEAWAFVGGGRRIIALYGAHLAGVIEDARS
ncbi:hypothetical protein QE392_001381 [Microbacterium proteolyticum]|uniref:hypothetical protein n=1 Tax=Microbacterium proteolyticum TaxID=1572644 RepID=UPI002785D792|nr:hypothetical protein [Microbacterium proteolyticum]MDQ1169577.1 hypothetical protein [Microbacterium proteolyticum]